MVGQANGKKSKAEHEGVAAAEQQAVDEELLAKLEEVQGELEKLDEEASNEVLEVERKYNGIRQPIYDRRNKIIETIPDFWLTAFLSHPTLSDLITDEDHEIFKHLQSLEVRDLEDVKIGYSIAFAVDHQGEYPCQKLNFLDHNWIQLLQLSIALHTSGLLDGFMFIQVNNRDFVDEMHASYAIPGFAYASFESMHSTAAANFHSNPYFENSRLTKTLSMDKEGKTNFTGTNIKWKDGRGTSTGTTNDKGGNKRPFSENSFFTWFNEEPTADFLEVMSDEEIDEVDEDNVDIYENGESDENATEDSEDDDEDA
ncbi:hypothetical protein ACLOJK_017003 [Asimina triloba]